MSLDTIIASERSQSGSAAAGGGSGSSASYGKQSQARDRNRRRQQQAKPYQPKPQRQQHSGSSSQQQQQLQQQQLQQLLSMPLSSFPQVLQQLPMLSLQAGFSPSGPFTLSLPSSLPAGQSGGAGAVSGGAEAELDASGSTRVLKVSSTSDPKKLAGSISHTCRLGSCPTLLATGPQSLNQAVKAIAIARGYLEENRVELSVKTEFRDEERGAVSMILTKSALRKGRPAAAAAGGGEEKEVEESELRVAQNSEPSMTAGSIAKKVRAGERLSIVSIGAGSVSQTVRAITIARRYLEADSLDLSFRPSFIHLDMQEGQRSAIKFVILAQQV